MGKQVIVTIGREYGSAGHEIGERIAEELGVKFYDRGMLHEIAAQMNLTVEDLEHYDEKPRKLFVARRVGCHSNSVEDIIKDLQLQAIKDKAETGESFVVVGRCGNIVLRDVPGTIHIFLKAEEAYRIHRIMEVRGMSEREAKRAVKRHDTNRRRYHEHETGTRWGDAKYYDLVMDSGQLGVQGTAGILLEYIKERIKVHEERV